MDKLSLLLIKVHYQVKMSFGVHIYCTYDTLIIKCIHVRHAFFVFFCLSAAYGQ